MPRRILDVQRDLDLWESQLDKHLGHCPTCDEGREKYCREGTELSVTVTRLLMEKMRLQLAEGVEGQTGADAHGVTPWASGGGTVDRDERSN